MPKRYALGTSLGLLARRVNRTARRLGGGLRGGGLRPKQAIQRACIDALESRTLFNAYFVSPYGSDWGNGSIGAPFRTIQEGANAANWGDTVEIEGGTYRETVQPPHSGVTFTNYNGQSVTITGTNQVGNFWSDGNGQYTANYSPNLGTGNNQVFVDGTLLNDASYPNSSLNPSSPSKLTISSYSGGTITSPYLNQPNGYWAGAEISITPGYGWVSYVGQVNNSGPGWINVGLPGTSGYEQPTAGNSFYLFGTQNALDTAGEYYVNSSNQLNLIDQYWDNPNYHDVEVKARQFGFELSGVSNTTIKGINLWACTIDTNWYSQNTVINGINANYVSQFVNQWGNGWGPPASGIQLNGSGDVLENSNIGYSAGDGVYVGSSNVAVMNNTIHDIDWSGTDAAGVRSYSGGITVTGNTIYNAGRDGINFQGGGDNIQWNTVHDFLLQTADGAGIYTVSNNGGGTIAYNNVYNAHNWGYNTSLGYDASGIMLDNSSSNFSVHDNSTSNVDVGFKANGTSYNEQIFNNKLSASLKSMETNGWSGFAYSWWGSNIYNNVWYNTNVMYGSGANVWGNSWGYGSPASPPAAVPPASPPASPPPVAPPASPPASPPPAAPAAGPAYSAGNTWTASLYANHSNTGNAYGAVGYTYNGSWLQYNYVNFGSNMTRFNANLAVSAAYAGQKIEVFLDSIYTNPIATLTTTNTGSWTNFQWQGTNLTQSVSGTHTMYIEFVGSSGIANLMNWKFT